MRIQKAPRAPGLIRAPLLLVRRRQAGLTFRASELEEPRKQRPKRIDQEGAV
jgi:hypothetical protein